MEFFATCPKGFEPLLADELREMGCSQVRPLKGQVSFSGLLEQAYRACLWSRLASRVVAVVARIDAHDSDALYASLRTISWDEHLAPGATFAVEAHGTNSQLRNTQFVALRAKDAIVDEVMARRGSRPVVDVERPGLSVSLRISRERATVGIDLSGTPLFRRGYEPSAHKRLPAAPLRSDYAAALLRAGGWHEACARARAAGEVPTLAALYAGAGVVLVEAAGMAVESAPGLLRQRWGFEGWARHDHAAWEHARAEAEARRLQDGDACLLSFETRRGAYARQMMDAAGTPLQVEAFHAGDHADLAVCDLSWVGADEVALQAEVLAKSSELVCASDIARTSALVADLPLDEALARPPVASYELVVGRSDATMRVYGEAPEGAVRPQVTLADGSVVPVYVAASDQFVARLAKVAKQRAKWARREDVSCYRVYDADLPDYAVTIDLYEESLATVRGEARRWLQVYEYAPPKGIDAMLARRRLLDVLALAPRILGVDARHVYVRTRQRGRGGSQYADEAQGQRGGRPWSFGGVELPAGAHLVDEGGLTFEVNFSTRLDCGIFLDHRDTRAMLREMAKRTAGSKRFLNLFAYTGTATCYAADGGMKHTTTVDLSQPSLAWAQRNMALNGFTGPEHEFVHADVISWVREQRRTAHRWDLVFCDVPTFSNSSRMGERSFDVQRDHAELLIGVSRLLTRGRDGAEGGICVFSCNLRTFEPDVAALAKAGVTVEDITARTIPEDFARRQRVHRCYLVRRA